MSSSSSAFSLLLDQQQQQHQQLDHHHNHNHHQPQPQQHHHHQLSSSPSDQLCYVHCDLCDTVLAVSVPCSSLFKTVTVRCGHCSNLLSVNMRALLLPSTNNQLGHCSSFFSPASHNLLEEIQNAQANSSSSSSSSSLIDDPNQLLQNASTVVSVRGAADHQHPRPSVVKKPPEKRQRVPSAYNRFIKDEIQRIKAGNPDISHREAFSAAAKNWAHFPHIHFGLMPDHQINAAGAAATATMKRTNMRQQEVAGEDLLLKDGGFFAAAAAAANLGVSPY